MAGTETIPNFEELSAALEFDPFSPPDSGTGDGQGSQEPGSDDGSSPGTETVEGAAAVSSSDAPAGAGGEGGQATESSPPAADSKPAGQTQGQEDLQKLVASQAELIRQLTEKTQAKPAEQAPKAEAGDKPAEGAPQRVQVYKDALPVDLFQQLGDEDDNKRYAAMNNLVLGIMNTLANDMMLYIKQELQTFSGTVREMVPQVNEQVRSAEQMKTDFFGAFPELNRPALGPVITQRLQQLAAAEMAATGAQQFSWSQDFRDRAGLTILTELGIPRAGGQQQAAPQAPAQQAAPAAQPRKPSFASGGGGAGGARTNGPAPDNDFSSVL